MNEPEILEVGHSRRFRTLRRPVRLALLGTVLVACVAGYLADRHLRGREEQAVAVCAEQVAVAVDLAGRRVQTTYEYVRPALSSGPAPALEEGLLGLVAESARGAATRLDPARRSCADVTVLPLHRDLRQRRDRCVGVLEQQQSALRSLAVDGATMQRWLTAPRSC